MASEHQNLIDSFMEITSSSPEEAQFFLESHNFDVDAAVSTFFESNSAPSVANPILDSAAQEADTEADIVSPSPSSPSASLSPSPSRSRSHSPPSGVRSLYNLRSRRTSENKDNNYGGTSKSRRSRGRVGGVRTLADLNHNSSEDSDSDHSHDHPPQYFTGGEKSGMVVQDPSNDNHVEAIFEQARRMGALEGPADVHRPSSSSRSFSGTARLLSGEVVPSSARERPPEAVTHTITFWRNGFTVDDGPLRRFDDEENAQILESIKNSECPEELQPADRKTAVNVNLVRRNENYSEPPKEKPAAFQGAGRTLGDSSSNSSEPSTVTAALNSAPPPTMGLIVDDKLPSTSIQLRLADGTRMVSRFNHHHTIRDIHAFIDASRPARRGAYTLQMMGFPPKQLTDVDQTVEQAGLANSVVIQKF
ncbi:plant UBX domain-containing protein 3-like [Amaranthus tricolor]|uniref:plant UBX domain-containing protein 3-like n=1 Tax=Amaranthus tricolor TaxID=29722 RepID=UPI00258A404C|nr:plant UBX domain-containing protein 3-like [Amaranthus tricolor]